MPTSTDIRRQFIDFFVRTHGHTFVPSSPVVPHGDPTLLFANAGMNQFKPYFLGTEQPPYPRAANTQKCIRAGGKHNDLEDVGHDTYHHTFFEMLGNWSFGDYFKQEAIDWAWQLLTDLWKIDPTRLHATYFGGDPAHGLDPDDEARQLWLKHLPADHVHPGNMKDNFWEMGDTGPCGPCSEIHYDRTPDKSGAKLVNGGTPDVIEIWNLVFIQFNRGNDSRLSPLPAKHVDTGMGFERICAVLQGKPSNYDTDVFMPLFAAIQKITGAREYRGELKDPIDIAYRVIADHARCLTFALTDGAVPGNEGRGYVLRRILRRAVRYGRQTFGMAEPFLHELVPMIAESMGDAFPELKKNPQHVIDIIKDEEESFARTLDRGIKLFDAYAGDALFRQFAREYGSNRILAVGNEKFSTKELLDDLDMDTGKEDVIAVPVESDSTYEVIVAGHKEPVETFSYADVTPELVRRLVKQPPQISGYRAFRLHGTYGFPLDLTQLMAAERGMTVDVEGFNTLMEQARVQSRSGGAAADAKASLIDFVQQNELPATKFLGYKDLVMDGANIFAKLMLIGETYKQVPRLELGMPAALVVDQTPFYAEQGGQVGDTGYIRSHNGAVFKVTDTIKVGDIFFHLGSLESGNIHKKHPPFDPAEGVMLEVDADRRAKIMANHTVTHVMNHKLRAVLGDHIAQRGSLVDDEKTRFDFSHNQSLPPEVVERIEQRVNADIARDLPVHAEQVSQEKALKIHGLRAVFGEKYPPVVRVVTIGPSAHDMLKDPADTKWYDTSAEFCGGTHVASTGKIGVFTIVSEEAVAKGVRRVIGLTGKAANDATAAGETLLAMLDSLPKADADRLARGLAELNQQIGQQTIPLVIRAKLRDGIEQLQKQVKDQQKQAAKQAAGAAVDHARAIAEQAGDAAIIVAELLPGTGADAEALRSGMDVIRKMKPDAAILLGASSGEDKVAFTASVPKELIAGGLKAGDWVRDVAKVAGGGGGGRPDAAQAGGKDPSKLAEALQVARDFAQSKIQG